MQVDKLILTCFKNYVQKTFDFTSRVVAVCGANGSGKTNMLDAIYHLCLTKSYFPSSEILHHEHKDFGWRIEAHINQPNELQKLVCLQPVNGKKQVIANDVPLTKLSEHIGRIPVVFIAPDDIALINEGSEGRRSFLDALISQTDGEYLQNLIAYHAVLQQRNAYLKSGNISAQDKLLDTYDNQLVPLGDALYAKRKSVTNHIFPLITKHYQWLSDQKEKPEWHYQSALHENSLSAILQENRSLDVQLQRTTEGLHRDDLSVTLNEHAFKKHASQGQKKSLLFAMKLASFDYIQEKKQRAPLLLLDDLFEKLDEQRMQRLLDWVEKQHDTQVFITDTHAGRVKKSFEHVGIQGQIIEL